MTSNIEKIAKTLLELKKQNNYVSFNKGFFKNKPEIQGYYIDLSSIFKNVGTGTLCIKKYEEDTPVSNTSYQILLLPGTIAEQNEANVTVKATDAFYAITVGQGGQVAIYEEYLED